MQTKVVQADGRSTVGDAALVEIVAADNYTIIVQQLDTDVNVAIQEEGHDPEVIWGVMTDG